ncbi:probable adenylyl-cyclase-associated protein CAP [Serendipita indica DSM 11827]|uniref:Adenylyl cyclase-associated protein n=1 Tax=Serendipita indica (strain DSM 11827) TaxID=1109443 RepID=G4TSA7_SERID|nr:probable adenylyl-cyclase-associated protein CAP [Serendipita indica DSM 11827]
MSSQGLNSLATIIKRLEAATSRLEDIAVAQSGGAISFPEAKSARPASTTLPPRAQSPPPGQAPAPTKQGSLSESAPDAVPASVAAYDERIIKGKLATFVERTKALGEPETRRSEFATITQPLHTDVGAIKQIQEKNRDRNWSLHLQTVADGAPSVGWLLLPSNPVGHIQVQKEAAEFYGNRVIKEYKEKNTAHVDWVRSYFGLIDELGKYVGEYYKMGLTWNPKGGKAGDFSLASASGSAKTGSSAPPPPPPPPPPPIIVETPSATPSLSGTAAVFAQLNQGMDITKGLRKVDKSEMTHKNPSLRTSGSVPARAPSPSPTSKHPPKPKKPASLQAKKPSKLELQGTKWIIEHQENNSSIVLDNTSISHIVTLYGCKNTVVQVKGKVNGVTMSNCQKTSIVVDSVVSVISITNSQSFQLQITGVAPTIQIETTDSGQVYLSEESKAAEIITAKCSAINISIPGWQARDVDCRA